jgi:hypothetical protein
VEVLMTRQKNALNVPSHVVNELHLRAILELKLMPHTKIILLIGCFLASNSASAAEMPKDLIGNYVYPNEPGSCKDKNFSLIIGKSGVEANEFNCRLIGPPKGQSNRYVIPMECASEDGSSRSQTVFSITGNKLKFDSMDYLACQSVSAVPARTFSVAKTCQVKEGYGGVASYYDPGLKRVATDRIRDFDGYTFVKEKDVVTGSAKSMFGKLIGMNGAVSEGSYVHPDDWDCK